MWQDNVLSYVGILFGILLLPQLYDMFITHSHMNILTCFLTAIGLFVLAYVYYTINCKRGSCVNVITASIWFIMGVLSI